jgi:hypothetical protein
LLSSALIANACEQDVRGFIVRVLRDELAGEGCAQNVVALGDQLLERISKRALSIERAR